MLTKKISNFGMLTISEQVILEIVHFVIDQYKPYIELYNPLYERIKQSVQPQQKNGIKINVQNNEIVLNIKVSILYGENISKFTNGFKLDLEKEIKSVTSFTIRRVDIQIEDIHFDNIGNNSDMY